MGGKKMGGVWGGWSDWSPGGERSGGGLIQDVST